MEDKIYEIEFYLEKKDYYLFNKWQNQKIIKFCSLVFFCAYVFSSYEFIKNLNIGIAIINLLFFILSFYILILFLNFLLKIRSNLIFKDDKILNLKTTIKLTNELIEEYTDDSYTKVRWVDLKKIVVRKNYIYLMMSAIKGIVIPLEKINNPDIVEFIKTKTNNT